MKKFFFSILAVGALVACTKSEVKFDDASEIAFSPVASVATKAAIQGNYYPTEIPFNVFSFYAVDVEPGTVADYSQFTKVYLNNKKFKFNGSLFSGAEQSYYWPKTGSLVFAGYSPCIDMINSSTQSYDFENGLTITAYEQSNQTSETDDLMWFDQTPSSYRNEVVPVKFTHACSWLSFYVNSQTPGAKFHIKKLVLNGVQMKGDFNSRGPVWNLNYNVTKPVVVLDGDKVVPINDAMIQIDDNGVIVLPQNCVSATITYTMDNGADVEIEQTQTFSLTAGTDGSKWNASRHYIYTIQFSATEILISPSVNNWIEVPADLVPVL